MKTFHCTHCQHLEQGPPPNWESRFISAYAARHPWEDWAESWAHFLHMTDALETAAAVGPDNGILANR